MAITVTWNRSRWLISVAAYLLVSALINPTAAVAQSPPTQNPVLKVVGDAPAMVIFIHGSNSSTDATWGPDEETNARLTFGAGANSESFTWVGPTGTSTSAKSDVYGIWPDILNEYVSTTWSDNQGKINAVIEVCHSNGGNIAVIAAANQDDAAEEKVNVIVRLASPPVDSSYQSDIKQSTLVYDVYDPWDGVAFGWGKLFGFGPGNFPFKLPATPGLLPAQANWVPIEAHTPDDGYSYRTVAPFVRVYFPWGGWEGDVHADMHNFKPVWRDVFEPVWFASALSKLYHGVRTY